MNISSLHGSQTGTLPGRASGQGRLVRLVVPFAVIYNGVLAIINAHGMPLGFSHVALVEISLLFVSLLYLFYRGLSEDALPIVALTGFFAVVMLYTSAANGLVFVDFFRNVLIIAVFCQMGMLTDAKSLAFVFRISCVFVLSVLLVEIFFTRIYEDLFYPSLYFSNTRGLEQVAFGGTKIFQNALNIPGRFSFGLSDHRTASIFLEQVSLANFSGVLCIYLVSRFKQIRASDRWLMIATVVFILLTNDSRSMLAFAFVCLIGYGLFPKISNSLRPLVMPGIILAGALVYLLRPDASGDTLDGRIVLTMKGFFDLDFIQLLALDVRNVAGFADSGYIYVINASTVFGLLAFWLFVSFYPAGQTAAQKRLAFALTIFLFLNMMIGGTAVFSIKVAALLWLLVGFLRRPDVHGH
ncbi:hypothetical protein [Peteryoungia ipomoeae]|uniref:Polymerase n=1 Tax=Peteryoungia ipomoeae TaxID=1210932 RepID=A0A4S8NXF5_9HYPH|nr:hypothetical protein [Peteryoungia ipomoeae]THV22290.1 hypothetical protein FAA97_13465 [Peteryoungia ipomoeae]